ncbi:MAG TPA: N-acyl homoserine lactonase family protein [Lapillicoccus sp.]|nr:N-acyl homoserine lactonase family protein [Lapillicoccus sp.]
MSVPTIDRLPLGYFRHPSAVVAKYPGADIRSAVVVCGYLVRAGGTVGLFDTGIVADAEAAERYRPRAFDLDAALARVGVRRADVEWVANCHLHADHAGGNHLFPEVPVYVQRDELAVSDHPDYTVRAAAVDYAGANLRVVDGPVAVAPGVRLVPTPGHSPGHQSMLLDGPTGPTLLAGQAFDTATEYALADLAVRLSSSPEEEDVAYPGWMPGLVRREPAEVLFAHDLAAWRGPGVALSESRPAPVYESELR